VPRDAIVFDVGAHAGQYAKLFAPIAPDGRVYAIEPGSYGRSVLRTAIWLRGIDNVTIVPIALGADSRLEWLTIPVKASGAFGFGLSQFGTPETRWPRRATELVAQTTVDDLAAALALDRLDFIKADIEGGELRMLEGARRSLERFRPPLLLELVDAHLGRAGDTLAGAFAFLADRSYRAFRLNESGALVALAEPREGDSWFFPAEHPLAGGLPSEKPAAIPAA
jgi:FkbM family methyltransferase